MTTITVVVGLRFIGFMFKKSERKLMLLKKRQQLENKFDTPHTAHRRRRRRRPYNIIEIFSRRNVCVVFLFLFFLVFNGNFRPGQAYDLPIWNTALSSCDHSDLSTVRRQSNELSFYRELRETFVN